MDIDVDRFVRPPSLPHQRDDVAGRVVGLVAPQRGVVEGFRGCERTLSAVEAAAHEKDPEVWLGEEVGAEKLAGDDGRANLPEARRDRVIHLGGRDELPGAGSAYQQHFPVVGQAYASVRAARGGHQRGEQREGIGRGVVDFSGVEVDVARGLAAGHEHGAVQ